MKHIFIINPIAGKKDSTKLIPVIKEHFSDESAYEVFVTERSGHATEIASGYQQNDDVCIYAIGGDGTACEVLNGLNAGVAMAVIPNGTGNDYYKMLMRDFEDVEKILLDTIDGRMVEVDYAEVNGRRYLNSSSMGFDADVNNMANIIGSKYPIPKSLVYGIAAVVTMFRPNRFHTTLVMENERVEIQAMMIALMNGRYYGGGFEPTPMSNIQDGLLDICLIEPMKISKMFKMLPKYTKGGHLGLKEVHIYHTNKATITTEPEVIYGCDGDISHSATFNYELVPNALKLRVPKESVLI